MGSLSIWHWVVVLAGGLRAWQVGALAVLVASLALYAWQAPAKPRHPEAS